MIKGRSASSNVFDLRRAGKLDEAYQLGLRLMAAPEVDEWTQKAMAWCLIDLIKQDTKEGPSDRLSHYAAQLEGLTVSATDEVLTKQRAWALTLCRPDGQLRSNAIALSKEKRHREAATLYRQLCAQQPDDVELRTTLAWELYRYAKQLIDQPTPNIPVIRGALHDYLRLQLERPSMLHSCFLRLASTLAATNQLQILGFVRLWDLQHLRSEDFDRFVTPQGETYSSLAEKVILQAGKAAAASNQADGHYVLPYLDTAIERYPDNTWLQHVKAKILIGLGRHDDALSFGINVVKEKIGEFWAWELLGTICVASDQNAALSCYCKALLCSREETFIGKLRLRLAQLLIATQQLPRAKCELMSIVAFKSEEGQRLPDEVAQLITQEWYSSVEAVTSNDDFYRANTAPAEALLFATLPWMAASLGERFVVPRPDGKRSTKRRLFVRTGGLPIEVSLSESRFPYRQLAPGAPLRVKGEFDHHKKFQLFVIEPRPDGQAWDVFSTKIGVVEGINEGKQVVYVLVEKSVSGAIPMSELHARFAVGDPIAVKVAMYVTKEGNRYRIVAGAPTAESPSNAIRKTFNEQVRAEKGMGFTPEDIFIPPPLMDAHGITDGDQISGVALWSLNKKRNTWGWKAVHVAKMTVPTIN